MKLHIIACVCLASAAARSIKTSEDEALSRRNTKGFFGRLLSTGRAGDKNSASAELALPPSKESAVTAGDRRVGRAGTPNLRGHEPKERVWNGEDAPKGEFPWMVTLHNHKDLSRNNGKDKLYNKRFCGGSLIAPQWALGRVREPGHT